MTSHNSLSDLADVGATTEQLIQGGLSVAAAGEKADLLAESAQALVEADVEEEAEVRAFFVPGRIEVLGKHTDYAGGSSILAAAEKGFCLIAAARRDAAVRIFDAGIGQNAEFVIEPDMTPLAGHWSNYPMTVARRLARNFGMPLRGADIGLSSDLPGAAGMSSSSAMVVATFLALWRINDLEARAAYTRNIRGVEDLAGYLGTVENGQSFGSLAGDKGVGTFGGSEDHTCMLCCRSGRLVQYAYCPVRFERDIPLGDELVFAIASSGVVAEKTGSAMEKYNRASRLAAAAAEAWRKATGRSDPHLAAAIAGSPRAPALIRQVLSRTRGVRLVTPGQDRCDSDEFGPDELLGRFEHFYAENQEIIPAAGDSLAADDLVKFGQLVDRSQELSRTLLGNQVQETLFLARSARELGAAAASAFGAGFGGSVWALVGRDDAQAMLERWAARYAEAFPQPARNASFFLTSPGPGAFEL